jgi:hypothetical protein
VEAVLIHEHLARLSPRLIPGSSPRSVLHYYLAARTGVEPSFEISRLRNSVTNMR